MFENTKIEMLNERVTRLEEQLETQTEAFEVERTAMAAAQNSLAEQLEAERQTVRELRRCLAFFDPDDDADAAIAFARRLNPEWDSLAGDDA